MLHLTSHEKKTVVFILTLLVLGLGLDFYKKKTHRADLINFPELEGRRIAEEKEVKEIMQ
ncbi:hypothetical protein ACFL2J_03535 [Candidatus Omnitrophota bacterium]